MKKQPLKPLFRIGERVEVCVCASHPSFGVVRGIKKFSPNHDVYIYLVRGIWWYAAYMSEIIPNSRTKGSMK